MMIVVGGVAAAVQVLIFAMESLWWNRPAVRRRFRMSDAQAEASRLFAFNQGAYNLFWRSASRWGWASWRRAGPNGGGCW
jgi:putative membrane protein